MGDFVGICGDYFVGDFGAEMKVHFAQTF